MMSLNEQQMEHDDQHGKRGSRAVAKGELVSMSDYPFLDPQLRSSDSLPVRAAPADTIDLDKVASHIDKAIKNGRYQGSPDPMEYLLHKQCVAKVEGAAYATIAGLLCFGRNPQATFPNAVVDIGHYRGTDPVSFEVIHLEKNIGGTIFDQLRRVEEYLWRNTHHGMVLAERSFERVEVHEYPLAVIRELGVNMLAHRDYTVIGSSARVMLFRNRIEWASPGGLPPGVSVENLLDIQKARNAVILSVLYEAGFVEAFGQGLDTVVSVLKREDMAPPTFRDVGAAFIVTVFGRQIDALESSPFVQLNDAQRTIVGIIRMRGEAAFNDIREALPERGERTVQEDIRLLIESNVIERVGKTRAVRYRLRNAS
jgi:ATP-dependent DNA helicase RecG